MLALQHMVGHCVICLQGLKLLTRQALKDCHLQNLPHALQACGEELQHLMFVLRIWRVLHGLAGLRQGPVNYGDPAAAGIWGLWGLQPQGAAQDLRWQARH